MKKIPVSLSQLEAIAKKVGTPYQLYDETLIRQNARHMIGSFKRYFPNFKQFFAVKALPNPEILKILVDEGCGLDCSSVAELHAAKMIGVPSSDVMYTSNYTSKEDLAYAYDRNVIMNLDDISLIESLLKVRGKMPELISFRLNPGIGARVSDSNVLGGPDAKFGVDISQIADCYKYSRDHGSKRFGIHMMTGSNVMDNDYWKESIMRMMDVCTKLNKEGIEFEFINVGGGIGIPYKDKEEPVDIESLAKTMHEHLGDVNLYMENGRYMTGPYGWLVSRCQAVKKIPCHIYYGLDSCMANLMRPGMYGAYHHISVPAKAKTNYFHRANVVGSLCENNDWFAKNRLLPVSSVGDLFVIHDTGAHSHSMGFQYNGKLRAPEILLTKEGETKMIRERDTIESLYGNICSINI